MNVLRHPRPRIAEVSCSKVQFEPGDRILVRVYVKMDKEQVRKLRKSITKWEGCDVEILIYNGLEMDIGIEKTGRLSSDIK